MTTHAPRGNAPRGFALPLVLVALVCSMIMVLSAATTTWRTVRGAQVAVRATRTALAAETAVAAAAAGIVGDSLLQLPLGNRREQRRVDASGTVVTTETVRTAPLVGWIAARATDGIVTTGLSPRAAIVRVLYLRPPAVAVDAALQAASAIDSSGGARLVGSGVMDSTACGAPEGHAAPAVAALDSATRRAALAMAWAGMRARSAPWSSSSPPADSVWRAAHVLPADSVVVGPVRVTGLVLHDGPLRLIGNVAVHGLLIVRGALDARAAQLTIRGALIVDSPAAPVQLGPAAVIWNRCAVEMALATVATPRSAPFHTWQSVTP
jgi:Tfp pilus assembly protein PilV